MRTDYGYFEEDQLGKPYDLRLLRRLFPHVRPYRFLLLLSIAFVTCITALDLALPYLTKVAIDRYIVQAVGDDKPGAGGGAALLCCRSQDAGGRKGGEPISLIV